MNSSRDVKLQYAHVYLVSNLHATTSLSWLRMRLSDEVIYVGRCSYKRSSADVDLIEILRKSNISSIESRVRYIYLRVEGK